MTLLENIDYNLNLFADDLVFGPKFDFFTECKVALFLSHISLEQQTDCNGADQNRAIVRVSSNPIQVYGVSQLVYSTSRHAHRVPAMCHVFAL